MNDTTPSHPDGTRLDALVVGDGDEAVKAHVASCASCAAYVAALKEGAAAFAQNQGTRAQADAFVKTVRERAKNEPRRIPWARATSIASGIALAAGLLLLVRTRPIDTASHISQSTLTAEGPVRFKGGTQVAVIVEHGGAQTRATGELAASPNDRIRLEIAVDHDVRLAAGVLTDEGEWADLQPPALFGAGTHYSEQAITFDRDVPTGTIIVGSERDVEEARRTRNFTNVTTLRVHPKTP